MARAKKPPKTAKEKKAYKLVAEIQARDVNPKDKRSDSAILRQYGYADTTKPSEVFGSKYFLKAHDEYYKSHKTTEQLADQMSAKARRNTFEGLDSADDRLKFDYTKLVFANEEKEASQKKLKVTDLNGNMMELMGVAAEEHLALNGEIMKDTITEELEATNDTESDE